MGEVRRMPPRNGGQKPYREPRNRRPETPEAGRPSQRRGLRLKQQRLRPARGQYDFPTLFLVLALVLIGNVMVFSSSYYYCLTNPDKFSSMYYFLARQMRWSLVGLVAMGVAMNFDYHKLRRLAAPGYVLSLLLLLLLWTPLGISENGSKRWLGYGSLRFQPSEVAKIAVVLFLAHYILSHKGILNTFKGYVKCMVVLLIPTGLIALSNLSTAIIVLITGMVVIFVASPKFWYFPATVAPVAGLGLLMVKLPKFAYRMRRITAWKDPFSDPTDTGYQIVQSLYAVASGGLFGLGLGQSRQKTFIPESYNDIIFAIICEELGLVGAVLVIVLFALLVWRGARTAIRAADMYGSLVASGIIGMIGIQALINMAVVTNTIPNTGVPLPFISYGGTSLVFLLLSMGILLNISRYQRGKAA